MKKRNIIIILAVIAVIAILIKIHKDKTVYLEAQEKIMIEYKLAAIMKNIL